MDPSTFADILAAYLELVHKPETTPDEREAFWASLEAMFPLDAVAHYRQAAEWYLEGEPEPPPDVESTSLELCELWASRTNESSD